MIAKPGKPPTEMKSYRAITQLPSMSKIFGKLLLMNKIKPIIEHYSLIPNHQF